MGKKVLIVESDNTILQVVSYFLNLEGFEIATVSDDAVTLEVAGRFRPDIILVDPGLSVVKGASVSRAIRASPEFKNVPILYLVENMDVLLKMGEEVPPGYGIIYKPIDPTRMVNTIKERMEEPKPSLTEQVEPMSIEELLGWDVTDDIKEGDAGNPGIELKNEPILINDELSALAGLEASEVNIPVCVAESAQGKTEMESEQTVFVGQSLVEIQEDGQIEAGEMEMAIPEPEIYGNEPEVSGRESDENNPPILLGKVEADIRERITDDLIKNMIKKIAGEFIEKVVLEVVSRIAEEEIKKEIERLKGDGE